MADEEDANLPEGSGQRNLNAKPAAPAGDPVAKKKNSRVCYFPLEVLDFSTQYGIHNSVSYVAENVLYKPRVYPRYEDNTQAFLFRTYGQWWKKVPSAKFGRMNTVPPVSSLAQSEDFLELCFEERLYPLEIRFYETYNPGAVVKVLCYCYETEDWKLLWKGKPEVITTTEARIFSPKLSDLNIKSDCYRIEFYHQHLQYYYELDAIILIGRRTLDTQQDGETSRCLTESAANNVEDQDMSEQSTENEVVFHRYFELLPYEVMHLIFSYLDLQSLCTAARVSRLFKKLAYDPVLYKVLDLQPYWRQVTDSAFEGLSNRVSALDQFNLSWCGSHSEFKPQTFTMFVDKNCQLLTCLKLSNCTFVDNDIIKTVASCCPLIQVLELRGCRQNTLDQFGFPYIAQMKNLIYLDLYDTLIDVNSIITIIRSCSKVEHLGLGCCIKISTWNDVMKEIALNLSKLKTLELWRAKTLTQAGINWLAEHSVNLVEIDLGWCIQIEANSGCLRQLIKSCTKLKKLYLTSVRTVSDAELIAISNYSKDLEQLDVLGTREISSAAIQGVLQSCKKLKLLDISFCQNVSKNAYEYLAARFPNVEIKQSVVPAM